MSAQVPAGIKSADLARFALRASQLEKVKPVVSYYCNFWIVNQILAQSLHNSDEECLAYTTELMDKLEQFKADNRENDAVTDDMAGKAYVEMFALETLQRADNAARANKASRQTADTFLASATFLELLQIWGEIDSENVAKIKYAKYHAFRIAKALKAGEDPNASNPAPESVHSEAATWTPQHGGQDDLNMLNAQPDASSTKAQQLNGDSRLLRQPSVTEVPDEADKIQRNLAQQSALGESLHPSRASSVPRPTVTVPRPRVEDVPDDTDRLQRSLARQSSLDQSLHPSRAPSNPPPPHDEVSPVDASTTAEDFYNQSSQHDVSPLGPDPPATGGRRTSAGENYFPQLPSPPQQPHQQPSTFTLPSTPSSFASPPPAPSLPPANASFSPFPTSPLPPTQNPHLIPPPQPAPPSFQPHSALHQPVPQAPPQPQHQHYHQQQPLQPPPPLQQPPPPTYAPASSANVPPPTQSAATVDEAAVLKAQKHARWAISALNFEDVPTAIKELRGALETLGAG